MAAATAAQRALLLAVAAAIVFPYSSAGAARADGNLEFVRRRCLSTRYPHLCYSALAGYAGFVAQDSVRLALVATKVSLARVRAVSSHVSALRRGAADRKTDARTAAALDDCVETLGDAAGLTRQSEKELARLPSAKRLQVAWRVSNAQTWMSAALTNEDTCLEGFAEVKKAAAAGAKVDVCRRVRRAKEYTSNALALVNGLLS